MWASQWRASVFLGRLGQLHQSVESYTAAIRLLPFSLDAYVGRGSVYMDYGHAQANKQAQRDFLSALHLNPLSVNARICLAYNFQVQYSMCCWEVSLGPSNLGPNGPRAGTSIWISLMEWIRFYYYSLFRYSDANAIWLVQP